MIKTDFTEQAERPVHTGEQPPERVPERTYCTAQLPARRIEQQIPVPNFPVQPVKTRNTQKPKQAVLTDRQTRSSVRSVRPNRGTNPKYKDFVM
jgi:hypothetical protein